MCVGLGLQLMMGNSFFKGITTKETDWQLEYETLSVSDGGEMW